MNRDFEVGEIVQFKSIQEIIAEFGDYDDYGDIDDVPGGFNRDMEYMCGQIFTIKSLDTTRRRTYYRSIEGIENKREDDDHWYISEEMLKPFGYEVSLPDVDELSFFDVISI